MDLLSLEFFFLCFCAVTILPALSLSLRWTVFLALNIWFVSSYLGFEGSVVVASFCLVGYGCARWAHRGNRFVTGVSITVLTAAFVYVRRYTLLNLVLHDAWLSSVAFPAGLSFLFFKIIHVIVDCSSGAIAELRLTTYANYCLNFTAFLMGPIQRFQDFHDRWTGKQPSDCQTFEDYLDAANRVLRGLVKKFVLAEFLGPVSLHAGADIESMSAASILMSLYAFYLYLYCDFSGYCDIVIGVGRMMGLRPPENFDLPFLSRNVSAYWLRVHRSLTLWLTDYIFTPCFAAALRSELLRGRALLALTMSLMVTMFVSGLWHGTTSSFVCFGLMHGVMLVVHRAYEHYMTKKLGRKRFKKWTQNPVVHIVAIVLTYNATSLAYAFFVLDVNQVVELVRKVLA